MKYTNTQILGIDVGGSGIKGNIVDTETGELLFERLRIKTPPDATPNQIGEIIKQIAKHFDYEGFIGCGFPAVIKNGVIKTATNIGKTNINTNANKLFSEITQNKVIVFNDADVAGIAEMKFGAGKDEKGVVILLTLGTGIGSSIFINNILIPNSEFGHVYMKNGMISEKYTSSFVRTNENLEWAEWGSRLNEYLMYIERILNPNLIILGGGVSRKLVKFRDFLSVKTPLVSAELKNNAGIVGAAMLVNF